jgi:hypothetical protein
MTLSWTTAVFASEARQSISTIGLDCRVAALLAMTIPAKVIML